MPVLEYQLYHSAWSPPQMYLRVHSLSMLIKILNSTRTCTDPLSTPVISGLHLDIEPLYCDILNPYPLISPSIIFMSFQFRHKDFLWSLIKNFAQVHVNYISCSSLVHMCYLYIKEGQQVSQAWFALYQATLTASNHLCLPYVLTWLPRSYLVQRYDWMVCISTGSPCYLFRNEQCVSPFPVTGDLCWLPQLFKIQKIQQGNFVITE